MAQLFEHAQMADQVIIVHKDGLTGKTKTYDSSKKSLKLKAKAFFKLLTTGKGLYNSMTNAGFAVTSGLLYGTGTAFTAVAIGTGTTAASASNTALITETKRKAGTTSQVTTTVVNDTAQWDATFSNATDGLSGSAAITEVGIFNNNASGGTLLLRQVFAPINVNWSNGDTLQMIVKCQSKQGA